MKHLIVTVCVFFASICSFVLPETSRLAAENPKSIQRPPSRFDYHDDQDGRNLADVQLNLKTRDDQPHLVIEISAVGPTVEPIPGFPGLTGANRYTAEELDLILTRKRSITIDTVHPQSGNTWRGSFTSGERGRLPERRIMPNGRIDFDAVTELDYPLSIKIDAGKVQQGTQQTEVRIDGVARLRVTYEVERQNAQIVGFESLGDPHIPNASPFINFQSTGQSKPKKTPAKSTLKIPALAQWKARDLEGKWVYFKLHYGLNKRTGKEWAKHLAEAKEYELLEWLVIYQRNAFKQMQAGKMLAESNAPQWVRAAVWARQAPQALGHGERQSQSLLITHNPALVNSWLKKYRTDFVQSKKLTKDMELLEKKKLKPVEVTGVLPPLKPADVFKHLDPPKDLEVFGLRLRAEPGKFYVHQVLRAIEAVKISGYYREPWVGKLFQLTQNSNDEVRHAALLTMTYAAKYLNLQKYSPMRFEKVIDAATESARMREAALMAFSYFDHPSVYLKLHRIARDPNHPSWRAAISRLGDVGDGFTMTHLEALEKTQLSNLNLTFWKNIQSKLRASQSKKARTKRFMTKAQIRRQLERVVWAELTQDSMYAGLARWTIKRLAEFPNKNVSKSLEKIQSNYKPRFPNPAKGGSVQDKVRALANLIVVTREANRPTQ